jgi:hypothetical protein
MSSILPLAAFHGESGPRRPYAGVARISGMDVVRIFGTSRGYLVIGLRTERLPEQRTDRVTALDLVEIARLQPEQYSGVLREYLFPRIIDGLTVSVVESAADVGRGLLVVYVPQQDEARRWFLICKTMEGTEQLREFVCGLVQRVGAGNVPMTAEQIYRATQAGRSPTSERLSRMEGMLERLLGEGAPPNTGTALSKLADRIKRLL